VSDASAAVAPAPASRRVRLPSIGDIVDEAQRSARRFPLVLLSGAISAVAGILLIDTPGDDPSLVRVLAAATLGLPLNFALGVLAERRSPRSRGGYVAIVSIGVAIQLAFWYAFPRWTENMQLMRYVQLFAAAHLFVAIAPFIGYREPNAFWQYNRILFLRFIEGAIYTVVLWVGLCVAFLALDKLLGVPVATEGYARLWMVMTLVFNPWFFIAGVPGDFSALESITEYPSGLRAFTQYVLVPIVVIYLAILTLYLAKVLVTREWPSGWIGYLVSGVAAVGILSWLLVHPLEERAEHAWVKTFTRGFYIALMPAVVMLWLAIWKRVDQYGITERRYFLIVLSVWLAGIAVYYTLSRSRSIKVIPATLCAVAVVSFAGPWGAYSVSRRSQSNRLEAVLLKNGLVDNSTFHFQPSARAVSDSEATAIRAGLRYLIETHGRASVDRWTDIRMRQRLAGIRGGTVGNADLATRAILTALNVPIDARARGAAFFAVGKHARSVSIAGYTYAIELAGGDWRDSIVVAQGVALRFTADSTALMVTRSGATILAIPLGQLLDSLGARDRSRGFQVPERLMTVEAHEGDVSALLRVSNVGVRWTPPRRITTLSGQLYLRLP
jgi:hypothetical protein